MALTFVAAEDEPLVGHDLCQINLRSLEGPFWWFYSDLTATVLGPLAAIEASHFI